jgi:hypothetical protein
LHTRHQNKVIVETDWRSRDEVRPAIAELVRERKFEDALRLLPLIRAADDDDEAFKLRTALVMYEHRRVARVKRKLFLVLFAVLAYLFGISPSVFVTLENPYRIAHSMSVLDWSEGLYWSVITSTTVGYGDIVPATPYGRLLGLFNALLGVLLMGVVAGLIVGAMQTRRIE